MKNTKRSIIISAVLAIMMCASLIVGGTLALFTSSSKVNIAVTSGNVDVVASMKITGLSYIDDKNQEVSGQLYSGTAVIDGDTLTLTNLLPKDTVKFDINIQNDSTVKVKYRTILKFEDGSDENLMSELDITVGGHKFKGSQTASGYALLGEEEQPDDISVVLALPADATAQDATCKLSVMVEAVQGNASTNDLDGLDDSVDGYYIDTDVVGQTFWYTVKKGEVTKNANKEEMADTFKDEKAAGKDVIVRLTGDTSFADAKLSIVNETQTNIGVGVKDIIIDAKGHTITNTNDGARCLGIECSDTARTYTIMNAKIVCESTAVGNNERRGLQIYDVKNATINLINCTIEMKSKDYSYAVKVGGTNSSNLTINIKGCTFTGANCIESWGTNCTFNIFDTVFNSNYAPNAEYCGNGIQDKNGTNNTYNIKNCTFNGTNAQPWQTSATTTINDLGENVNNTKITKA